MESQLNSLLDWKTLQILVEYQLWPSLDMVTVDQEQVLHKLKHPNSVRVNCCGTNRQHKLVFIALINFSSFFVVVAFLLHYYETE